MTNRKIQYWVIPPEADAEFVAHMEEVLETYEKPYNPAIPVLCMDEQPVQLIKEIKTPIEATLEHAKRVDYEYERAGTANIFMFTEPLDGWRHVSVRDKKTKVDWAIEIANLLEGRYSKKMSMPPTVDVDVLPSCPLAYVAAPRPLRSTPQRSASVLFLCYTIPVSLLY